MITTVKLVSIPVRDQDASLQFYTQILGFKTMTDQPFGDGQRWIELRVPRSDTHVVLFTPPGQEDQVGGFSNIVFGSDDVHKAYEALRERGVEFTQPPKAETWGTFALFKDPDGNVFCLSSKQRVSS